MKLDVRNFRYLSIEDWRVLSAVETGSKNHEVVPTSLINQLSGLRTGTGAVGRSISTLAKADLIAKVKNVKYDGYRLTYGGFDYLALHSHMKSAAISRIGSVMGVGKESDILLVNAPQQSSQGASSKQEDAILKIHRLGRTSFRTASNNRAYQGSRLHCTWQHLSKLSAKKEFFAMKMLHAHHFRVPRPIAQNRHAVVMSLVPGVPLRKVRLTAFGTSRSRQSHNIAKLYHDCVELAMSLAEYGLIHGDLNEFNILIENVSDSNESNVTDEEADQENSDDHEADTSGEIDYGHERPLIPHLIDFPQITSFSHPQAEAYFDRDIKGIKTWFHKRYHFESDDPGPGFSQALQRLRSSKMPRLDIDIQAAGYNRKDAMELEKPMSDLVDGIKSITEFDSESEKEEVREKDEPFKAEAHLFEEQRKPDRQALTERNNELTDGVDSNVDKFVLSTAEERNDTTALKKVSGWSI